MSTHKKPPHKTKRTDTTQCPLCGEDYAITYRRCPFCDEISHAPHSRHDVDSHDSKNTGRRTVSPPSDGGQPRRTNASSRHKSSRDAHRNMQILVVVVTLALIITAAFILFKWISPLFGNGSEVPPDNSGSASTSQGATSTPEPTPEPTPDPTPDPIPDPDISSGLDVTDISLSHADVTLTYNSSFKLTATTAPSGMEEAILWSVSDNTIITIDADGNVTNINPNSRQYTVTVTATIGDITETCIVRAKAIITTPSADVGTDTPSGGTGTDTPATAGSVGTITGAGNGLNVRASASATAAAIASLLNNTNVTITEVVNSDWYQISFIDVTGNPKTGYVSSAYIVVN